MKNKISGVLSLIVMLTISLFSCVDPSHPDPGGTDSTEVEKSFCGVPPDMMIQLIRNYKTEVWSKTSNEAAGKYDARFMEINIEQLENFLAYAKQSARRDGLHVAAIRMYYINYPGQKKNNEYLVAHKTGNVFEDYAGCHSLALVPVVGADIHDAARRDYYNLGHAPTPVINAADFRSGGDLIFVPDNCGPSSLMENHNELCPPMKGCITSTLLQVADGVTPYSNQ